MLEIETIKEGFNMKYKSVHIDISTIKILDWTNILLMSNQSLHIF